MPSNPHNLYNLYSKLIYLWLYLEEEHGPFGYFGFNGSSGQSKGEWSQNGLIVNSFEMCHHSNEYMYACKFLLLFA